MSKATCTWDNTTASRKITRTKRYNEKPWQAGWHTPNTWISSKATLPSAWRDRCTTPVFCQLWHMVQIPGHWPNKHRTNLRPLRLKWKEACSARVPIEAICCKDVNCENESHRDELGVFYKELVDAMSASSDQIKHKRSSFSAQPC